MSKTPQELGLEFQDHVQRLLTSFENRYPTTTQRLYDTRSAGNYLPSQPGDFITLWKPTTFLIEAKATTKYRSFSENRAVLTSLVDIEQAAKMWMWDRAGAITLYVVKFSETSVVEFWDGADVYEALSEPRRRLQEKDRLWAGSHTVLKDALFSFFTNLLVTGEIR